MAEAHRDQLAELKIPAQSEFISVAKRVATSLAVQMGFTLEEIDELGIAVSQACDSTIDAAEECWGGVATLKLAYSRTARGIAVEVEALAPQSAEALARIEMTPSAPVRQPSAQSRAQQALTQEMIRLFVDDFLPQIDAPRGRIRFRMVKYLVS